MKWCKNGYRDRFPPDGTFSQDQLTIYEYRSQLIECMQVIQAGDRKCNDNTVLQASGFEGILKEEIFVFWLTFFHKIMPYVDILFNQLQKRDTNQSLVEMQLKAFEREICEVRTSINSEIVHEDLAKKRRLNDHNERKREAIEVCDVILREIKDRFSFTGHLGASALFQTDKFADYEKQFPDETPKFVIKEYSFINEKKIRTELSVVYNTDEFKNMSGILSLMEFIRDNNLSENFSECVKLLQVLLTIPMTTSEAERCFSTLKRVKTFIRNAMSEERLSALAMLSIERDFIFKIADFNQRVIEKFASSKERRADLLYT